MDTFAHGLWNYIIGYKFRKKLKIQPKEIYLCVLFGIIPDLLSWGIYLAYNFIYQAQLPGKPVLEAVPEFVFTLYGITHSIIVFGIVMLVIYLIFKKVPVYLFGWLLHILIDIPSHSREFLPTPFLWPVSSFAFPGISWANKYFFLVNYTLIVFFIVQIVLLGAREKYDENKARKNNKN